MREKARCCSAHRDPLAPSASSARNACLCTRAPLPATLAKNHAPSACLSRQCCRVRHCAHYQYYCRESGTACSACDCCRRNLEAYFTCVWVGEQARAAAGDRTGAGRVASAHAMQTGMQPAGKNDRLNTPCPMKWQ